MVDFLHAPSEGSIWEYCESPLEMTDIESILAFAVVNYEQKGNGLPAVREIEGYFFFIPGDSLLPKFHSILSRDGRRWDALNRVWEDIGKDAAKDSFDAIQRDMRTEGGS